MKFLCVACDEAMLLEEARGPEEGSMTVLFACPSCGRETALLTNAMETQVVRSLGVKIGGRGVPSEPMEMVRTSLAHKRDDLAAGHIPASGEPARRVGSGSKCPFTDVVEGAYEGRARAASEPRWTQEAEKRMERVPSFVQPMAREGVEQYAREQGYAEISGAVLEEMKGQFGL